MERLMEERPFVFDSRSWYKVGRKNNIHTNHRCLSDNQPYFATALACEGTTEGETSHTLLTWHTAKLSLIDGSLSRLVLGAITKPNPLCGKNLGNKCVICESIIEIMDKSLMHVKSKLCHRLHLPERYDKKVL